MFKNNLQEFCPHSHRELTLKHKRIKIKTHLLCKLLILYKRKVYILSTPLKMDRGSTVVKVLCYKSEGRWFDPTW